MTATQLARLVYPGFGAGHTSKQQRPPQRCERKCGGRDKEKYLMETIPVNEQSLAALREQRDSCAQVAVEWLLRQDVPDAVRVELATQAARRSATYQARLDMSRGAL